MRDLIDKLLNKGYSVLFSMEGGYPVIRIIQGTDTAHPVKSCSLGAGNFRETVEESLQALILDLERHPE
jgi:hypothetical protein